MTSSACRSRNINRRTCCHKVKGVLHLVVEAFGKPNTKFEWHSGYASFLPVVVGVELLDGMKALMVTSLVQTILPAAHHVTGREKLLVVGGTLLLLIHVYLPHLGDQMTPEMLQWFDTMYGTVKVGYCLTQSSECPPSLGGDHT